MPGINKRLGKNATVSTLLKNVIPPQRFRDAYPNDYRIRRGRFIVEELRTKENGKKVLAVKHTDYGDELFEILPGNAKLEQPGPPNQYFNQPENPQHRRTTNVEEEPEDDPEPDEDGIPNDQVPLPAHGWIWEEFKDNLTTDWRGAAPKNDAYLNVGGIRLEDMRPGQLFDCFFSWEYVRNEMIPATNNTLQELKQKETNLGEMKLFFGLWLIISLNPGYQVRDFFIMPGSEGHKRDFLWNPPYLGDSMSRNRFDNIHQATRLRKDNPPPYKDKFWHIRLCIQAFNQKMTETFVPSWLTCLDESMVIFFNAFAPGWMNVPRKPHPFGNEYHTIACCDTHIIFYIELVEGKDRPSQGDYSVVEYEDQFGKVGGLVTRMTQPIWGSSRVVLLDSGFGYLNCLQALNSKGLYGTMVIKKRKYWPVGTEGDVLLERMSGKEVGSMCVREGTKDGTKVWIAAMADSKHTSIMGNTWSTTIEKGRKRKRRVGGEMIELSYGEYQHWYYYGRHAVDDNNNNRQGHLPFEEAYCAKRWDLRQFGFVMALAQTNAMLAYNYFVRHKKGLNPLPKSQFQRELAKDLVYNTNIEDEFEDENERMKLRSHTRPKKLPEGVKWAYSSSKVARGGHELVRIGKNRGKWNGHEFPKIATEYSKLQCSMKYKTLTRTFCYCDFILMLCTQCYGEQIACINNNK